MKKTIFKSALIVFVSVLSLSCNNDDDNGTTPAPNPGASLGTFVGNLQVTDDPQTNLGYVYNAKVTVTTSGSNATIKITGNEGFDREYSGVVAFSSSTATRIDIKRQTKPVDKIAGNNMVISNNNLAIDISLASDNVTVKATPSSTTTVNITGKIRMLGTDLLKQ